MFLLVGVFAAVAILSVVGIAVATIRAMYSVEKVTNQVSKLTGEIQRWVGQASAFTREARETVVSVRGVIPPIRRVVERYETLGERTADLSAAAMGEVEPPVRTAVAVAHAARSGTAGFPERLSSRFTHGRPATNGEPDNE